MDKEIKDYKDDSNEEKNTETNEKNDLIDKEIEKESEISNEDNNNEIDKENQILNTGIDKPIECNKSKIENIEVEFESDEDLIEKEDIDINEDIIDKNKIKNKFKLTKKTRNIILIGSVIVLLLAINIGKTVSKYENKIFPGTLVYEQDISNLEKGELLSKLNKIEKNIEDKKVQININNKRYDIQIKNLVSKYNNEKLYKNIIKNQNEKNILSKFISIASKKNTNYNLYVELFGEDYDFSAQYATDYWCRSIENMIIQQLKVKDQHPEVIQNIKKILKELQVKTWYKNRTKKDQIDYEISQCLKENEYDRVVEIYENKLEVFQKQERKASRNQMLRRIVRKLKIRKN